MILSILIHFATPISSGSRMINFLASSAARRAAEAHHSRRNSYRKGRHFHFLDYADVVGPALSSMGLMDTLILLVTKHASRRDFATPAAHFLGDFGFR